MIRVLICKRVNVNKQLSSIYYIQTTNELNPEILRNMFQKPSPDLNFFHFISFTLQLLKQTQTETPTTQGIQVFLVFNVQ